MKNTIRHNPPRKYFTSFFKIFSRRIMPPKNLVGLNRMPASQGFARPFTVLSAHSPFLYSIRALPNNLHYFYFSAQVKLATDLQNTSKKYALTYLHRGRCRCSSWYYSSNKASSCRRSH